jgi:mannose-1-phosphate guanylyltransferase
LEKAMLLAAGSGTRLRPLTEKIPKVMVPIGGKPLLEHTIVHLAGAGIRELVINLCYHPEAVQDYFRDGARWGVRIHYSIETEALGTAGGVKRVQRLLGDAPFLLWYGDNLSRCDVRQLGRLHEESAALLTLAVFHRDDPTASGIVGIDPDGRIRHFLEKPRPEQVFSHWVNAGIMVVEPRILEAIPPDVTADLSRDTLPLLLSRDERLYAYRLANSEGLWWIDTPADLQRVQENWNR